MSCHVCSRQPSSRLSFHCPTCARNQLYQLRVEIAQILVDKESAGRKVEAAISENTTLGEGPAKPNPYVSSVEGESARWVGRNVRTHEARSVAKTESTRSCIEVLRKEIKEGKEEITRRKAVLAQRRSDAESLNYRLRERRDIALGALQNEIKKKEHRWNTLHNKTAESRIFLCREAANLYNLRQRRRSKNGEVKESYTIGGVPIVDLRDMNSANPAQLTASLVNITHLLMLVSHYLSLRLPAEVTLPHRNYPFPTIFNPSSSYMHRDVPFPGTSPSHSSSASPTASRIPEARPLPRPRPLFTDKALPKLVKDDPATYALFIEGVSLLAWNISWVCRTQGLHYGSDSWEDVCDMGRNLWQLLVAPPSQASTLMRVLSSRDVQAKQRGKDASPVPLQRSRSFPILGHYSHGTAHSFLGAYEGVDFMRTWRLPSPIRIMDSLKQTLLGEMASAEWELLEENEWDDQAAGNVPTQNPGQDHPSVAGVSGNGRDTTGTSNKQKDEIPVEGNGIPKEDMGNPRPRGMSGWTKLKNR